MQGVSWQAAAGEVMTMDDLIASYIAVVVDSTYMYYRQSIVVYFVSVIMICSVLFVSECMLKIVHCLDYASCDYVLIEQ